MNKPMTLREISKLIDGLSVEDAMTDKRVFDFLGAVQESGKELLKERGGASYVKDAADLLCASVVAEMIEQGDFVEALELLSNPLTLKKIMGIAFIYSVGIGIVEELH